MSLTLILRRVASRLDGTAGVLLVKSPMGDLPLCVTLEDPWRDNRMGESCIPAGFYFCVRTHSTAFGPTYLVQNVPGRSGILFHPGNTQADTRGCILPGLSFGSTPDSLLAVQQSRVAFKALLEALAGTAGFDLVIEDCWGGSTALPH